MANKYQEKFEKEVQGYLVPDNSFWKKMRGVVSKELTAHIPQYDTIVEGNAASYPLSIVDWANNNNIVIQKEFISKAYRIGDYENFFTSQDMKSDLMKSMVEYFDTAIGNFACYKLAAVDAAFQVFTTGTATRDTSVVGSSESVKKITMADMLKVRTKMAQSNLTGKWFGVMDSVQIEDLLAISEFTTAEKLGIRSRLLDGQFVDILGIKIYERNPILGANVAYASTTSPDAFGIVDIYGAVGTADAVTNLTVAGSVFYNENAIYTARGLAKIYANGEQALYQGSLVSGKYTFGIEKARTDKAGCITLIEQAV
jgi:hypothetical protein